MRLFKGAEPERDTMGDMMALAGKERSECAELAVLCSMLERNGVEHEHSRGLYECIAFDSPHGRVLAMSGPGTIGFRDGLLEAYCEGWDMSPRGNMTARRVYEDYMSGGW